MTERAKLPSHEDVLAAQCALLSECAELGTRPTVIGLAHRLGMTNPTFWRHFPQNAEHVASAGRRRPDDGPPRLGRLQKAESENIRLRRDNQSLTGDLRLAEAVIQRLALENDQLRHDLETARHVTNLDERRRSNR